MINTRNRQRNEEGLVAIVVTMIIMLILTLIVTGFAQLARREQREALDRQLAAQATYAAESGINIGKKLLKDNSSLPGYEKTQCTEPATDDTKIDSLTDVNVEVTCLLIKTKLDNLQFNNIQQNKSTVSPIFPSGAVMDRLIVSWQNSEGNNDINTQPELFPKGNEWNNGGKKVGLLRIELVEANASSREEQRSKSYVFYARPRVGATGETDYATNPTEQGKEVPAQCSDSRNKLKCQVAVKVPVGVTYYIRMTALYNPVDAYLCGATGSSTECNRRIIFDKSQAEIDSTGRANDVLKRILVRTNAVPNYNGSRNIAEFALDSSESICKLNYVWPDGGKFDPCP